MLHLEKVDWGLVVAWIAIAGGIVGALNFIPGFIKTRKKLNLPQYDIWLLAGMVFMFITWFTISCCICTPMVGVTTFIFEIVSYCISERTLAFIGANTIVIGVFFLLVKWGRWSEQKEQSQ
jgi:uncharacterized membrane protein YidH (DUF202 family)